MTSSEMVAAYDRIVTAVLTHSEDQLADLFLSMNFSDVPLARDELKRFLSALVDYYGSALTQGALDWYQELRPAYRTGYSPNAVIPKGSADRIDRLSRYVAGIGSSNPGKAIRVVAGALGRELQLGARRSILRAADLDPSTPRFARVPVGKTCAFCTVLASRGWVYRSEDLAGGAGHEYHDLCNCRIIPDWEHRGVPGYNPEDMYSVYLAARRKAIENGISKPDQGIIASYMRSMQPDMFTDGVGVNRSGSSIKSVRLEKIATEMEKKSHED